MNNDITVTLKTPGEMKSRQSTKSKKPGGDDAAFGQALASASSGNTEYRDNSVETAPKQEKQSTSGETGEKPGGVEGGEGSTAVTPEALAEKLQTVQAGQFIRSMLKGDEAAGEALPEETVLPFAEMAMAERGMQGAQDVAEMTPLVEAGLQTMVAVAETDGRVEVPGDVVKEMDAVADIQMAGMETMRLDETEVVPTTGQKSDDILSAHMMAQAGAAQTDGQVHKQTGGNEASKEDEFKIPEVKSENHVVESVETTYTQRLTPEQDVQPQSHVTETGDMREEYADMLKDMIIRQISQGKQELEISLTPRSLGKLIVKVAVEAGETTVSIICTNSKAMQAMSQKAGELGRILEDSLGDKMEVVVDTEKPDSYLQQDGRNAGQEQGEQRQSGEERQKNQEADTADFLQQLRLGLA